MEDVQEGYLPSSFCGTTPLCIDRQRLSAVLHRHDGIGIVVRGKLLLRCRLCTVLLLQHRPDSTRRVLGIFNLCWLCCRTHQIFHRCCEQRFSVIFVTLQYTVTFQDLVKDRIVMMVYLVFVNCACMMYMTRSY